MGNSVYPAAGGGGIKSVQRGLASAAGTVTITSVNTSKAFVTAYGTTSSGSVPLSGTVATATISTNLPNQGGSGGYSGASATMQVPDQSITAGTNTLVTAVVQAYLTDSVTLTVTGACRYEVIEFA